MSITTTGIVKGNTGDWEMVIGLEVHAQVWSKSKLFSGAPTEYGAEPNENVSLVDAAMPGMLPVINAFAIEQAVKTGLGLGAKINPRSVFDRKNYFYPDLPQGYQISQFLDPIVGKGEITLDMPNGDVRKIGVTRLHMEQDAGKSLHEHSPKYTYIDLNRAGIALMEIVSEPDLRTPEEAGIYLKKLRTILRYLGTCDGDMDKGNMRCDANISMRRAGEEYGTRCEIKNVNSVRFLMKAIEFEANRQVEILESGGKIIQETRLFDSTTGETRTMRSKEDAQDYRYFPDPDLPPLEFDKAFVQKIRESLPELPDQKKQRYVDEFGLMPYDAGVIVAEQESATYFEEVIKDWDPVYEGAYKGAQQLTAERFIHIKLASTFIINELFGRLNKMSIAIESSPISPMQLRGLLELIVGNSISGSIAKTVLDKMFESGKDAATVVKEEGLEQVTDTGAIEEQIDGVIAANPDKLAEFRSGKDKLFGFFVGQVMKATGGKANPQMVNDLLKKKLAA